MESFYANDGDVTKILELTDAMYQYINEAVIHYSKYKSGLLASKLLRAKVKKEPAEVNKMALEIHKQLDLLEDVKKKGLESALFSLD